MGARLQKGGRPRGKFSRTKIRDFLGVFHFIVYLLEAPALGKWEEVGQLGPSRELA